MIDDCLVIDGVAHCYNFALDNLQAAAAPMVPALETALYDGFHVKFSSKAGSGFTLDAERYMRDPNAERLAHALFAESQTDIAIYHEVPMWGIFRDGGSPIAIGRQMRSLFPGRVALYGAISPFQPDWRERLHQMVEEDQVCGVKFYPLDLVEGAPTAIRFDDAERMFPVLEQVQALGIRTVGVHKSMPMGPVPLTPFLPTDVEMAAGAFPGLNFEIVHGGFAFLEETAFQLERFPNVSVNLEGTSAYLINRPRKFAEIIGAFLAAGAEDRITWATGCVALHPRPFIEALWNFSMPADLIDGYGFPDLTTERKRKILGLNQARISGLDVPALVAAQRGDAFSAATGLAPPWSWNGESRAA
jgi:uncharacterized protein